MERCYAPAGPENGQIVLDRDESHHLTRVRRVSLGKTIQAFDGHGHAWQCRLVGDHKNAAILEVLQAVDSAQTKPLPEIWIGTAVPKGDRFDWIVEKATELGVARLVPLECARSVVEPRATKLERLRRSVVEACKQCGRNDLMTIDTPLDLAAFVALPELGDLAVYGDRGGTALARMAVANQAPQRFFVAIGPEGGWDDAEHGLMQARGWQPLGLGPFILRVETAVVAAAAAIHAAGW
jgi:16S rRNA (uracil1498-N3)-methyltransferase